MNAANHDTFLSGVRGCMNERNREWWEDQYRVHKEERAARINPQIRELILHAKGCIRRSHDYRREGDIANAERQRQMAHEAVQRARIKRSMI